MLDRRLLNASLTVWGIVNEPGENPSIGTQYIVGAAPTGDFSEATTNSIARYDGTEWKFFAPRAGTLEVLNATTGEILQFNGTTWTSVTSLIGSVAPISKIVSTGTSLPATATEGDLFLKTDNAKLYTATAEDTWDSGVAITNRIRYASSTDFKIYEADGGELKISDLPIGGMFLNETDGYAYTYNGENFVKVGSADEVVIEMHTLTSKEVNEKSFTLSNFIKTGTEEKIMLSACGLTQTAGIDFTASGNTISWNGKDLEVIGLMAGDRFTIHYTKA